ncbi:MAG: hypothetical protein ABIG11_05175, partial [bacterium]
GFMLAGLAVLGGWATDNPAVALSTPLLILGVPVFDIIYITVSRIRRGAVRSLRQWIDYTDRDHFHHRLLHLGMTVPQTVAFVTLVTICLGLGAWTMYYTRSALSTMFLLIQSVLIFAIVTALMLLGRNLGGTEGRSQK